MKWAWTGFYLFGTSAATFAVIDALFIGKVSPDSAGLVFTGLFGGWVLGFALDLALRVRGDA